MIKKIKWDIVLFLADVYQKKHFQEIQEGSYHYLHQKCACQLLCKQSSVYP